VVLREVGFSPNKTLQTTFPSYYLDSFEIGTPYEIPDVPSRAFLIRFDGIGS
jgi:hypothetical protein